MLFTLGALWKSGVVVIQTWVSYLTQGPSLIPSWGYHLWKTDDILCVDFVVISLCIYYLNGLWAWLLIDTKVVIWSTIKYPWGLTSWWSHTHTHSYDFEPHICSSWELQSVPPFSFGSSDRKLTPAYSLSVNFYRPQAPTFLPLLRVPPELPGGALLSLGQWASPDLPFPTRLPPPEHPEQGSGPAQKRGEQRPPQAPCTWALMQQVHVRTSQTLSGEPCSRSSSCGFQPCPLAQAQNSCSCHSSQHLPFSPAFFPY